MHPSDFGQAIVVDDRDKYAVSHLPTRELREIGIHGGICSHIEGQVMGYVGDKSFSTSQDAMLCRNNVDSVEILPIFHKLLEDKRSSHAEGQNSKAHNTRVKGTGDGKTSSMEHSLTNSTTKVSSGRNAKNSYFNSASAKMRSCPDMSVRCDIVEYL